MPKVVIWGGLQWLVFVPAVFTGAFLIFLVQPMVAKQILPWFGGVPAVWGVCLAFFQVSLFSGYAYAHVLVKYFAPKTQIAIHAILLLGALACLPVLPDAAWKPHESDDPSWRILSMLSVSVGLPFLMLASTGPLVQVWFARVYPRRSPYPLYAVSNVGSLAALLLYPFLIEPLARLSLQSSVWSIGFVLTCTAIVVCGMAAARRGDEGLPSPGSPAESRTETRAQGQIRERLLWLAAPALAVMLFMGVTNEICRNVVSVPFLWILPLGIYLLTFILSFASHRFHQPAVYVALCLGSLVMLYVLQAWHVGWLSSLCRVSPVYDQVLLHSVTLFSTCMLLHGELYRLRPNLNELTAYYLSISAGGALGGLFVGFVAPKVFNDYYELPLALAGSYLVANVMFCVRPDELGTRRLRSWLIAGSAGVLLFGLLWSAQQFPFRQESLLFKQRGFFGVLTVVERDRGQPNSERRVLLSGPTLHGIQFRSPPWRHLATSYYGPATGIGLVLGARPAGVPQRIGFVGLGVGTLAAYGRSGDQFIFYEIDPSVVQIARDARLFTFLEDSPAQVKFVTGDARLKLEDELRVQNGREFDQLVIDAFTGGAIPVHLLTQQAFSVYLRHLRPDGFLAMHLTNDHLDLTPVVRRIGAEFHMGGFQIDNRTMPERTSLSSTWVFLARDADRLVELRNGVARQSRALGLQPGDIEITSFDSQSTPEGPLWTDGYSNLFRVFK